MKIRKAQSPSNKPWASKHWTWYLLHPRRAKEQFEDHYATLTLAVEYEHRLEEAIAVLKKQVAKSYQEGIKFGREHAAKEIEEIRKDERFLFGGHGRSEVTE